MACVLKFALSLAFLIPVSIISFEFVQNDLNDLSASTAKACKGEVNLYGFPLAPPYYQTCCDFGKIPAESNDTRHEVYCLPSFIIAGCQKSGTTALAAMLDEHPHIAMSSRKELHFFDKTRDKFQRNPRMTTDRYATEFRSFHTDLIAEHTAPFITGEATPFYVASQNACKAMAATLPNVKLIMLVRDPVERALSEYMMNERRVIEQQILIDRISDSENAEKAGRCFLQNSQDAEFYSHRISFSKRVEDTIKCLTSAIGPSGKWPQFVGPLMTKIMSKEKNAMAEGGNAVNACLSVVNICFPNEGHDKNNPIFGFNKKCFFRMESAANFTELMREEIQTLNSCYQRPIWESGGNNDTYVLEQVALSLNDCMGTIVKGIAKQYLYRGLYALQLHRCTRYIPADQIMVIHSDDLRIKPVEILDEIQQFIGVPKHEYSFPESEMEEQLELLISQKYPDFQSKTGWRLNSDPVEISESLRTELYEFFEPHNEMLFKFLGREFEDWKLKQ